MAARARSISPSSRSFSSPQVYRDLGKLHREPRQGHRQDLDGALHADAEAEQTAVFLADLPELVFKPLVRREHDVCRLQVLLPGIGQPQGRDRAVEERHAVFALHLADHLAQGRLAHIELFGSGGNVSLLRDRADIQRLLEVHKLSPLTVQFLTNL